MALLAVLYYKRRFNPNSPAVPLAEVETRMGFPREYLDFTTWYLKKKGFITTADNSDFTLTAAGVDFVESQRVNIPVLNKLLTAGGEKAADDGWAEGPMSGATTHEAAISDAHALEAEISALSPDVASLQETRAIERRLQAPDRRANSQDQRAGMPDPRMEPIERRMTIYDRRRNPGDRRENVANQAAEEADLHADAVDPQPNGDRRMDIAAAMDRLIAMVDESMDAIYGNTGEFANSLGGQMAGSARE